jgi:quercetin dioxygenase-like cupin family protein
MKHPEVINLGSVEIHYCLEGADTNGGISMFRCVVAAGSRVPAPHYHEHFDETIYGLEGTTTFTVDGKELPLGPGDYCFIPRGAVHGFENRTDGTISFLAIASPGVFQASYFRELSEVLSAGSPPDLTQLKEIMMQHGLIPSAPALRA